MSFTVVYDACVLYPAPLRDLLLRLAETGVVRARWTEDILDEAFRSIATRRPDLSRDRLDRTRRMMCAAIDDCLVTGYEGLADHADLPDPDDRHVLAAAVRCSAQNIVTMNLKDFPSRVLAPLNIEAQHPDTFVLDLLDLAPGLVLTVVQAQADALRSPPVSLDELLVTLERNGLMRSVAEMRMAFGLEGT
ncbi:MAG: PIN domain-containing protein [Deltaproteobacteria bacterium]|nr:PIN domain-containing protein [Deltaproteobacteria bacterium]